jgi:hypothetical protein
MCTTPPTLAATQQQLDQLRRSGSRFGRQLSRIPARQPSHVTAVFSFEVVNHGQQSLQDVIASLWVDADLGNPVDDLSGCDPTRQLGYAYNADDDAQYGAQTPALGVDLLRGPHDGAGGEISANAFTPYTGEIRGARVARNFMTGLLGEGTPFVDPTTGSPTTWVCSGDPLSGAGWIDSGYGDRRMLLSTGPFSMAVGDTQRIWFALLVGDGLDRLTSIADLRATDDYLQAFFDRSDLPPPSAATLFQKEVDFRGVHLGWYAPGVAAGLVDRRGPNSDWNPRDTLKADDQSRLLFEDRGVKPGETYGYRLVVRQAGTDLVLGEVWVDIPPSQTFVLKGMRPNPSSGSWVVEFSLPESGWAVLELIDVQGRRLRGREVGDLGPGWHRVDMTPGSRPGAGLYFLRLHGEHGTRVVKTVVLGW